MRDIQINNKRVLNYLNNFKDFIVEKYNSGELQKDLHLDCKDQKLEDKDWLSDKYLKEVMDLGKSHEGYPVSMRSYKGIMPGNDTNNIYQSKPYLEKSNTLNQELMTELSAQRNTLYTIYPPGGWISWHNNANASGYNVIFSWSETGDGWFDYWDLKEQKRVRVQDKPGWQCKMGYFGSYKEPDKLCYHAAYTDCLRISVAYIWGPHESMWEDVIEDIENPIE